MTVIAPVKQSHSQRVEDMAYITDVSYEHPVRSSWRLFQEKQLHLMVFILDALAFLAAFYALSLIHI